MYVDGIVVASSSSQVVTALIQDLRSEFALKELSELHYFLGVQVKHVEDGLSLSQDRYASEILQQVGMSKCKPVTTPLTTSEKLSATAGKTLSSDEASWYRSIVGSLQYLTLTRPYIHAPTNVHMTMVRRILRYIQGTSGFALKFHRSSSLKPSAFSNVDWASCPNNRRSTSGFAIYLGANLVSWSSRKQQTVSRLSTEAEYKVLANVTTEIIWVQSVLRELGI